MGCLSSVSASSADFSVALGNGALGGLEVVNADVMIRPAREQVSASLVPGQGSAAQALFRASLVGDHRVGLDVLQELLAWKVKNLDAFLGTDDEPIELLREKHTVHR